MMNLKNTAVGYLVVRASDSRPEGLALRKSENGANKRSGESSHQEIRKLLIGEELGDRRPSELLRVMRRRAESHSVPDDLMLELFQQHLPTRVQSILAAISPLTLEKAAEVADRVMEVTPIAVSACSVSSDKNSIESHVLEEIKN
ncbi:uncharacterized protein TNCV_835411 [Trichonephila clavipes]|nr:uncharacterized protein TNCV_835411 [Trichonephila clavipes]